MTKMRIFVIKNNTYFSFFLAICCMLWLDHRWLQDNVIMDTGIVSHLLMYAACSIMIDNHNDATCGVLICVENNIWQIGCYSYMTSQAMCNL